MAPDPKPAAIPHPDLGSIFIYPETGEMTSIIDWQSSFASESYFQRNHPQMLTPVESPPAGDSDRDETGITKSDSDVKEYWNGFQHSSPITKHLWNGEIKSVGPKRTIKIAIF
jgi:hypothetical protein